MGGTYKSKKRDFESVNFYYDINALNADVTNIYDTNGYLNQENIANGTIKANTNTETYEKRPANNLLKYVSSL